MEQGKVILFIGDSITDGNRYKDPGMEWDLNHQMGHSYAYIVNGIMGCKYPEKKYVFKNRGISGNRIADVFARKEADLFALKPDVLSILVGINNGPLAQNNEIATSEEEFDVIYRLLLKGVKERLPECQIVLMEPFVCKAGWVKDCYEQWRSAVSGYGEVVKQLAQDFDAVFIPLQKKFDILSEQFGAAYWSWDGIHPTENGHGLIAMEWMKAMEGRL